VLCRFVAETLLLGLGALPSEIRETVLRHGATYPKSGKTGSATRAICSAGRIKTDQYHSVTVSRVTSETARHNKPEQIFSLIRYALSKTEIIRLPWAISYATGEIIFSLIEIN